MPVLRRMDAKTRAKSRSRDRRSGRHRTVTDVYGAALMLAGRIKAALNPADRTHRTSHHRRYLALPVHDDPRNLRFLEAALFKIGLVLVMIYALVRVDASAHGERDLFSFAERQPETIEVVTHERAYVYRVHRVAIVERDDAALLRSTGTPSVTLVTSYPFYFVGPTPQRFVVQGELVSSQSRKASVSNRRN